MITKDEAFRLSKYSWQDLSAVASTIRDDTFGKQITFSPKVFIPLTQLCRDVCSYCTFAKNPSQLQDLFMPIEKVLQVCKEGVAHNCAEALFTLGESPESRHEQAKLWLDENGFDSTIDYVTYCAKRVIEETGMLPHINPGAISDRDLRKLKEVSVSQGMMLESIAGRLCEPGGPHFGSPDKTPARRLAALEAAGRSQVPYTTGILVGIGETRLERIEALLAIRESHQRFGHVQEVIVQNFMPKELTAMGSSPACSDEEHLWSIAAARIILGNSIHIQAPPNLASSTAAIIEAGVDDLGGISPVTMDYVNPEMPWPHLDHLSNELLIIDKFLKPRAAIYPEFIKKSGFVHPHIRELLNHKVNKDGYLKRFPGEINLRESEKPVKNRVSNQPVSLMTAKRH